MLSSNPSMSVSGGSALTSVAFGVTGVPSVEVLGATSSSGMLAVIGFSMGFGGSRFGRMRLIASPSSRTI